MAQYSKGQAEKNEEKKNRFQVSQEIKEEFVNKIAEMMLSLGKENREWHAAWNQGNQVPFCADTGKPYSGVNSLMLMLTQMVMGYDDARWMTFNQMENIRQKNLDNPEYARMHVRKGEKSTVLLRPETVYFVIDPETDRWISLTTKRKRKLSWQTQALAKTNRTKKST